MTHRHHIIPKHAGGTDDPSNIIILSIEDHAEAHRLLFEQFGRPEDELAWKGLSGMISRKEIISLMCKIASSKATRLKGKDHQYYGKKRPEHSERMKKVMKEYVKTDEHILKLKKAVSNANKSNPPRSTKWILIVDGVEMIIHNLKKFCRENGYVYSTLYTRGKSKNCILVGKYGD